MTLKYRVSREVEASDLTQQERMEWTRVCHQSIGNAQSELVGLTEAHPEHTRVSAALTEYQARLTELLAL
jgi:hypothetical protein